jgi:protein TonB
MQRKLITSLLIVVPLVGMGQGLKKKNAVLEVTYLSKLQTYDSLFQKAAIVNASCAKSYKVFEKIDKIYRGKHTAFTKRKMETIETHKQLMLKDSAVILPFDVVSIQSLVIPSTVVPDKFYQEMVMVADQQAKKDYSIHLEVLSKKEQNGLLINTIDQIEKEMDSLRELLKNQLHMDSILNQTNQHAVKVTFPFVDSLINVLRRQKHMLLVNIQRADFRKNADPDFISMLDYPDVPYYEDYDFETFTVEGLSYEPREIPPPPPPPAPEDNMIHDIVEESAEFPGGIVALKAFIEANLEIPAVVVEKGIVGKCYLQFIVSKSGNISNVKSQRGVPNCPECDAEAIRMVKSMPAWKPGKIGGKPVHSTFNLPVSFKLPK